MVLEKTLESPLNCKEIKLVRPKGDQSWIFIGRTDAEAEAPILWPPNAFWKTLMLGKIEGKRRREQQRMRWLDGITESIDMSKLQKDRGVWCATVHGAEKTRTWLSVWTTTTKTIQSIFDKQNWKLRSTKRGFPSGPVVATLPSKARDRVWSSVRELGSHMPHDEKTKP